jgi:PHD/YefM family antitoxin component YafN of YafNO toxin-antitoxin module
MNTIQAQEIKRRGVAALDDLIAQGDVHILRNNQLQYVVLSEARYAELLEAQEEALVARVRASLEDLKAGRVRRFTSAEELMEAMDREDAA